MTSDNAFYDLILGRFVNDQTITPYRGVPPVLTDGGIWALRSDRLICAVGIMVLGSKTNGNLYEDAAVALSIPVVMVIGIAMGFDRGPLLFPISPTEGRGLEIGAALSKRLLDKRPSDVMTASGHIKSFWP